jgi:hypothetical protein
MWRGAQIFWRLGMAWLGRRIWLSVPDVAAFFVKKLEFHGKISSVSFLVLASGAVLLLKF